MARFNEMTEDGNVVGQWFTNDGGSLGIVATDHSDAPYICFYPDKPKAGVLPHAIYVEDGDLKIQIPDGDGQKRRVLSVNKILEHLSDSCECESNIKADAPKPG